jgi:hypothetical protein
VLVHDWPQDALGQAVPYGVYEVSSNVGFVCVGDCFDTPRFAADAIGDWWFLEGQKRYRDAHRLLILADAGGSNSCRSRVWKARLQELSDIAALPITVCHYPPGCSKWNPIEHRLFSHISLNWAGVPLRSFDTVIKYIEGTQTSKGLRVRAELKRGGNELGERVSNEEMKALRIGPHAVCPAWNYTISPRPRRPDEIDQLIFCGALSGTLSKSENLLKTASARKKSSWNSLQDSTSATSIFFPFAQSFPTSTKYR